MARRHQSYGRALLFFLALVAGGWAAAEWGAGLPSEIHLMLGRGHGYVVHWPISVSLTAVRGDAPVLRLSSSADHRPLLAALTGAGSRRLVLYPVRPGKTRLSLRLFGLIPLRERQVTVLPEVEVVPGGQAIGVLVAAQGMIVTGFSPVPAPGGGTVEPARKAGVKVGDLVSTVNGKPVYTAGQLENLVNAARGRPVVLEIRREGETLRLTVIPVRRASRAGATAGRQGESRWRLGVYVEDPTAGVGTLSFWEPRRGVYGALGHMITDSFSRQGVALNEGRIVPAVIAGVQPGRRGQPGEKIGLFHHTQGVWGTIDRNTTCGIFGRILRPLPGAGRPVPVATRDEVRVGPAEIRTVVQQQQVESFHIEIVRIRRSSQPTGKGLVLRVDDPRLLSRTGGIVQGMSGSPILQDGRLVGVVTHVFVNDPTRGYGVLAEWMAWESGLVSRPDQAKKGESRAS